MPGLNQEIWTSVLLEQYNRKENFLGLTKNLSAFVENNKINFAEAGARPDVLVNNTSYPVGVQQRTDKPLEIALKTYDTKASHLANAQLVELSYDKMKSVVQSHTDALEEKEAQDAAHAFAPTKDANFNPVIGTSGSNAGNGFAEITEKEILALAHRFDLMDVTGKRTLILHPTHFNQLLGNSEILRGQAKNGIIGKIPMVIANVYGFDIVKFRSDLLYDVSTSNPTKLPLGTVADGDKGVASFAFVNDEVAHASGSMHMFETLNDATYKGDLVSFQHRFIADVLRDKYTGAIVSKKA